MRTLFEIVDGAKDGQMPTHDECYWAMLALAALLSFDQSTLQSMAEKSEQVWAGPFGIKFAAEESFRRYKSALDKSPEDYMGWSYNPANPDYQAFRAGKKLIEKFSNSEGD